MTAVTDVEFSLVEPAVDQPAPSQSRALAASSATPADLVRYAMDSGADLDRLEKLMALQVQWEERQALKSYNVAFAAFKAEAVRVLKNKSVTDGPLKGKSYAELHSVVDAITPALSKHGLGASWRLTKDDRDWIEVTCTLKHVDGHSESVSMGGPPDAGGAKNAIQARASTVSYLERYTLKAIAGVAEGGDDNDGAGAKGSTVPPALLNEAEEAALGGWKAFASYIARLSPEQRGQLTPESARLKQKAKDADAGGAR